MKKLTHFIKLPSEPMQEIYDDIRKTVNRGSGYLIYGETGVGKEAVARYIHENGPRRDKPFIALNCGGFTRELLHSELFGHEVGAFTDAKRQRIGAFEEAEGGVLFLDEFMEMSLQTQPMLLRVLDGYGFRRLGGNRDIQVDTQIITATNRDIYVEIAEGRFRQDLYWRLVQLPLYVPPLRERVEDIPSIVEAVIEQFKGRGENRTVQVSSELMERLQQHPWPGNIRQLRNVIHRSLLTKETDRKETDTLQIEDMPDRFFEIYRPEEPTPRTHLPAATLPETEAATENEILNITGMDRNQILRAVAQKRINAYGTLGQAAASLGIDTRTLQKYAAASDA